MDQERRRTESEWRRVEEDMARMEEEKARERADTERKPRRRKVEYKVGKEIEKKESRI